MWWIRYCSLLISTDAFRCVYPPRLLDLNPATLLTLNDLINECLKRYDQLKKSPAFSSGKQPTAAGSGAQSSSAYYRISLPSVDVSHVSVNRDDTIASKPLSRDTGSLIDLGVPVESHAVKSTSIAPPTHKQPAAAVDLLGDLDGLTFSSNSFAANVPNMNATNPASFFSAPPLAFANTFNPSLSIPAPTNPPFSSMNGAVMSPASNLPTSMRNSQPPPSNQLFSQNPPATPPSSMSLSGVQSGGKMLTGGGGGGGGSANASTAFDDLTGTQFTKLPSTTSKPPSLVQMYDKNGLLMQIQCGEETRGANALSCTVIVTNTTAVLFTRFSLQLALPKVKNILFSSSKPSEVDDFTNEHTEFYYHSSCCIHPAAIFIDKSHAFSCSNEIHRFLCNQWCHHHWPGRVWWSCVIEFVTFWLESTIKRVCQSQDYIWSVCSKR